MNDFSRFSLRCPVCGASLEKRGNSAFCKGERAHCFDFAKSGYLNLTAGRVMAGDLKPATDARRRFLSGGYYAPLLERLKERLRELSPESILDAGCGEGYYTEGFAEIAPTLGVDLSKSGVDAAAKEAKQKGSNAAFAVANLFALPVSDASFDVVTNLFAPCAEGEFLRVLKPGGHLLLVGAGKEHLLGLKRALYDEVRENPGRVDLPRSMCLIASETLRDTITVRGEDIADLFLMTPYYFRTSEKDKAKLLSLSELTTEISFDLFFYEKEGTF